MRNKNALADQFEYHACRKIGRISMLRFIEMHFTDFVWFNLDKTTMNTLLLQLFRCFSNTTALSFLLATLLPRFWFRNGETSIL